MKRYTFTDWVRSHKGQGLLYVSLGYWRELGRLPVPGRIFRWQGWLPDLWYYVKCRVWRRYHVITVRTLPPTWSDADERMLHAMFEILRRVIEDERIFERNEPAGDPIDGESWAWALAEMRRLWDWWTIARPERIKEYDRRLSDWSNICDERGRKSPEAKAAWDALNELDESITDLEDDEMLHALIRVRRYLWT
jgi:hypothetical protein